MSRAYCIFINTLAEGRVPSVRDEKGQPFVFKSEVEAQREIIENAMQRMTEFMRGEREFDDAITIEEYIQPVEILEDGRVVDGHGEPVA